MAIRTQASVDAAVVREAIQRLLLSLGNVASAGTDRISLRDAYLKWVEDAERSLAAHVVDDHWPRQLQTERYWKILELSERMARPWPLIQAEIDFQQRQLQGILDGLVLRNSPAAPAAPDETVLMCDTNAYLHFRLFDEINWPSFVENRPILIVVPMVVIEELDNHKNQGGALAKRAQTVTKRLHALLKDAGEAAVVVRDGVRIAMLPDVEVRSRDKNNDEHMLARVQAHLDAGGRPVTIVTGDLNMQLRAKNRGLAVLGLPDDLRLPAPDPTMRRIRALEEELRQEREKAPVLSVCFSNDQRILDPAPAEVAPNIDIDDAIRRLAVETPEMSVPTGYSLTSSLYGPSPDQIRRYNRERRRYLVEMRSHLEETQRLADLTAGAVRVDLLISNVGSATSEDAAVTIRLVESEVRLMTSETLEMTLPPVPPAVPVTGIDIPRAPSLPYTVRLADDQVGWELTSSGEAATIVLPRVRHGGSALAIEEPLFLVDHSGGPLTTGIHLEWRVSGIRPPVMASGSLDIRPRK